MKTQIWPLLIIGVTVAYFAAAADSVVLSPPGLCPRRRNTAWYGADIGGATVGILCTLLSLRDRVGIRDRCP